LEIKTLDQQAKSGELPIKRQAPWGMSDDNYFGRLKENRGIAMRSCKTDQSVKAFISIAATVIHIK